MELKSRALAVAEALVLAGLGLFMLIFAFSADYWLLLNPKFRWLTGGAGGLLAACAVAAVLDRQRRAGVLRLAMFGGLLIVCLGLRPAVLFGGGQATPQAPVAPRAEARQPSRIVWQGHEYVKINTGELAMLAQRKKPAELALRYVFRAQAAASPRLQERKMVLVGRMVVFCCLADAVVAGFVVRHPGPPLATGDWVEVYGRLAPSPGPLPEAQTRQLEGGPLLSVNQDFVFEAERLLVVEQPPLPYVFTLHQCEPYTF